MYAERTLQPFSDLLEGNLSALLRLPSTPPETLKSLCSLERANVLAEISSQLPTLVAGAYSLYSRRQLGEALVDAWVVVEQIIDYIWTEHVSDAAEAGRKERLRDTRTYTAAVRTEILYTAEVIDQETYQELNQARSTRNRMAHRAVLDLPAADQCLQTMKMMIELICGSSVEPPLTSVGVNW